VCFREGEVYDHIGEVTEEFLGNMMWVLLLLLGVVSVSAVPQCLPPNVTALPMCAPYVSSLVYSDPDVPNPNAYPAYYVLRRLGHGGSDRGAASFACIDAAIRLACMIAFPPCSTVTSANGQAVPVFSNPCASTCSDFNSITYVPRGGNISAPISCLTKARGLLLGVPTGPPTNSSSGTLGVSAAVYLSIFPTCASTYPQSTPYIGGQPRYGDLTWQIDASTSRTVPCTSLPLIPLNETLFPCFNSYARNKLTDPDGGYCQRVCPNPWIDRWQLDIAMTVYTVLAFIGWVLTTAIIFLRFTVASYSRFPASLIQLMFFGFWVNTFAGGFLNTVTGGWNYNSCAWTNDGNAPALPTLAATPIYNIYRPRFCPGSYLLTRYGVYIYYFSWAAVAVFAAVTVFFKRDVQSVVWKVATLALILLLPLILMFCDAYIDSVIIGPGIGGPTCVVQSTNPAFSITPVSQWITFTAPVLACIAIGAVCIIYVLGNMLRISDISSSYHVVNNIRLVFFLFWMIVLACTSLGYFIHVYLQALPIILDPARLDPFVVWLLCGQTEPLSTCPPKLYTYNPAYFAWATVITPLTAVLFSILFLSQKQLYTDWSNRIPPWVGVYRAALAVFQNSDSVVTTSTTAGSSSSSGGTSDMSTLSDLN
jgi:hypothetical protein